MNSLLGEQEAVRVAITKGQEWGGQERWEVGWGKITKGSECQERQFGLGPVDHRNQQIGITCSS